MSSSVVYRKEFIFDIDSKKIKNEVNQRKNIYMIKTKCYFTTSYQLVLHGSNTLGWTYSRIRQCCFNHRVIRANSPTQ